MSDLQKAIQDGYAQTANSSLSSENQDVRAVAEAFGYSAQELASIPAEANMGLSCGNPIATASIKEGETVLDLGSGGGLDVFLAAQKVGPTGQAIGVDMTPAMIERANKAAMKGDPTTGGPYRNVQFKLGQIDDLPLADNTVDVVISNCVVNLAPDKNKVFAEMFRTLKPGGRVAISDIALKQDLPPELGNSLAALVGCIAGAIKIEEFERGLQEAGFESIAILDAGSDLTAYAQVDGQAACCAPPSSAPEASTPEAEAAYSPLSSSAPAATTSCCSGPSCCEEDTSTATVTSESTKTLHNDLSELFERFNPNDYAASVKVLAIKPH